MKLISAKPFTSLIALYASLVFPAMLFSQTGLQLDLQDSNVAASAPAPAMPSAPDTHVMASNTSTPAPQSPWLRRYLYDTFGPGPIIGSGILALRDQGHNRNSTTRAHGEPPEWGQGAEGYFTRYGSRYGQFVIANTVRYGTGALLHEDVTYRRCECSGFAPRVVHVFVGSFTAETRSGHTVFSLPNVMGPLAAGQVATAAWYPSRYGPEDGLRLSIPLLIGQPVRNAVREFLGR